MARTQSSTNRKTAPASLVTQAQLEAVLAARARVAELRTTLRAAEKTLEVIEGGLIARIRAGVTLQAGRLAVAVEQVTGAIRVEWKDVAFRLAVRLGVDPVKLETEEREAKAARMVPHDELRITERG